MSGMAVATPSTFTSSSAYLTGRLAVVLISSVPPERVKMISALRFCERRSRSFDSPRASPVNSITRQTPSATPAALTTARTGRWRTLAVTRLSIAAHYVHGSRFFLRVQVDLRQVRAVLQDEDFGVELLVHLDRAGVLKRDADRVVVLRPRQLDLRG